MFVLESQWINKQSQAFAPQAKTVIDIGSESLGYRSNEQKHIAKLYADFIERGLKITTLDKEAFHKPDVVHDITRPIEGLGTYDIVIAANILEHIPISKIPAVIKNLYALKSKDGIIVVTVPFKLPRHGRPIDTMFRPTAKELTSLMDSVALTAETWIDEHFREPFISNPSTPLPSVTGGVFI